MRGKPVKTVAIMACALALAGCGGLLPRPPVDRVVRHDFGPTPRYRAHGIPSTAVWVTSVPWLAGTGIHYRLLYQDPTAVHSYASNRWLAPPAELLAARVHARLGGMAQPATGTRLRLRVTILRFAQDFRSPHHAIAHMELEARLVRLSNGTVVARHIINIVVPCDADIQGAVAGLSQAARRAVGDLAAFVSAQTKGRD
ncbi:MAG: ABC-type transport auxiliary lipoprotein family protein [Gammaproteobacteria bacterium]|nr:ABC-type transport auxiliary lipoprotein family protein [Gammaproteobacteria bacterium]